MVSPDELNAHLQTYIVAALTTGGHRYPFRVPCRFGGKAGYVILARRSSWSVLRQAVESIKAQTYHDWELLVVDNGSTDQTVEYLQTEQDQRIDLIRSAHRGNVGAVRNHGVSHARGRFVAFLDSDDLWKPTKLERPGWCSARWWWTWTLVARARF